MGKAWTNPNLFQGKRRKKNYFEGWYYKQVSTDGKTAISFIPGISLNEKDPHCFVQYILVQEGVESTATGYVRFPTASFIWNDDPFAVKIEDNFFSESLLSVHLETESDHIEGNLKIGPFSPIHSSISQPSIMGPYAYVPKMECYHGITSMNHVLEGSLLINGKSVDFTGGKGYIEKDWGTKFPKNYVWLQSNHFDEDETSLFFSMAHVPFYFRDLLGFISNIQVNGKEYRFATYNNSKIKLSLPSSKEVLVTMENNQAKVKIYGKTEHQGVLLAPVLTGMDKSIKEGVSGTIEMELWDKTDGFHYQGTGTMAGIEMVDAHELETK
ncbi:MULTISPECIES: tocopherol cyclase family protein [unclassified Jeotgalibaca]|uniref:tocopherol cyclase family protein n=1 Tax=unclassified Jeotgalibaca TaxID=2621505 RepID=UPI003FD37A92